jgi:hypothetical protein
MLHLSEQKPVLSWKDTKKPHAYKGHKSKTAHNMLTPKLNNLIVEGVSGTADCLSAMSCLL